MAVQPVSTLGPFGMPLKEKRRHPRVNLDTEVWIGQDGIFAKINKRLEDLSASGAFVHIRDRYAIGAVLNVKFRLPDDPEFIMSTVVVRNNLACHGLGMEFLDLSSRTRERIQTFVDSVPT